MKEKLKALGLTDEQVADIMADLGKSYVSKSDFNAKNEESKKLKSELTALTKSKEEVTNELDAYKNAGINSTDDVKKMQAQLDVVTKKLEQTEKERAEEKAMRIKADIHTQAIEALTKHKAIDPQAVVELLTKDVVIKADGTYAYKQGDKEVSIEEGAKGWLDNHKWAAQNQTKSGSGGVIPNGDAKQAGNGEAKMSIRDAIQQAYNQSK